MFNVQFGGVRGIQKLFNPQEVHMSYVRLNITDRDQTNNGEVHGSLCDAVVGALAAEPEMFEEFATALERFSPPQGDVLPLHQFTKYENLEPYDAGIIVVDLAARVVAVESSYSSPSAEGGVRVEIPSSNEGFWVPYRLSEDWLFVYSIPEYEGVCTRRRDEAIALKLFDAREVLYGKPLLEFIARECSEARDSSDEDLFTRIHAKWLMTARDDMQSKTPREVLLGKKDFIDFDLQSRELQWSFTNKCPPPLMLNSSAYTRGGFGTHELVVYYELVRYLLGECFISLQVAKGLSFDEEIARLEKVRAVWLDAPNREFSGWIPSRLIESERRRLNVTLSGKEFPVDDDCPTCAAMAEHLHSLGFWHLDGCNMDDGFEFSFHKTREEYDAEQRRWREFNKKFEEDAGE